MGTDLTVCRCDCGCGRVIKVPRKICQLCAEGKHPLDPMQPPESSISTQCWVCDGFMVFDVQAKKFKCSSDCRRRGCD